MVDLERIVLLVLIMRVLENRARRDVVDVVARSINWPLYAWVAQRVLIQKAWNGMTQQDDHQVRLRYLRHRALSRMCVCAPALDWYLLVLGTCSNCLGRTASTHQASMGRSQLKHMYESV